MLVRTHHFLILICILTIISGCKKLAPFSAHFDPIEIKVETDGEFKKLADRSLTYFDSKNVKWTAPVGTLTDGASVPRLLLPITNGRWRKDFLSAAVVHDAYCQKENEDICREQFHSRSWRTTHRMFYEACLTGGTPTRLAQIMYVGILLAGPKWDDTSNEQEQLSDELLTSEFLASKLWISQKKRTLEDVEARINARKPVLIRLHNLKTEINTALDSNDLSKAQTLLLEEDTFLERELTKSPNDIVLLNFKGNLHFNRAITYQKTNLLDKANIELRDSEIAFKAVIKTEPNDPGTLKGLGNAYMLQGKFNDSEGFLREAIKIAPKYEAVRRDLETLEFKRRSDSPN